MMSLSGKRLELLVRKSRCKLLNRLLADNTRPRYECSVRRLGGSTTPTYDYVIVGAGSAGCIVANRLSKDPSKQVLLIEAGPEDNSWKFAMPAALMYTLTDPRYNWKYFTQPQKYMDQRSMYWPRGKVWGGCSSHNAMVYVRGHAADFDRWATLEGANGWSYADCLPYFKRSTSHSLGEDEYRGGQGLQYVARGDGANIPLHGAFIDAALQTGYPYSHDINGFQQEGFGYLDMTIECGVRASTSTAFLRPALSRQNLQVVSNATATKILFSPRTGNGGNPRAIGVTYLKTGGGESIAYAGREVVLCGGPINSPQLLMLSGIGNADHLKQFEIPLLHHLPGVGANLQDHLEVYVQHECLQPITLYEYQWKFPLKMAATGIEWFISHTGAASTTHLESGGFIRSRAGVPHPDIQFHFLPSTIADHGQSMSSRHSYQVHVGTMRPSSRGSVTLQSRDPLTAPLVDPNYLATQRDRVDMRSCVRLTREIFDAKAFEPFRGKEILPGPQVTTDKQIDAFIRSHGDSAYHPAGWRMFSGTCRMGDPNNAESVLDSQCNVIGVQGLRVVDSSIMPSLISGNLNAPTIMIAEKASDMIIGNEPLPPLSDVPVYKPKNLDTQR